jgi:gliding motility-associated-like protein
MYTTRKLIAVFSVVLLLLLQFLSELGAQVAGFAAPDTVYVNQPVAITNTSTGGSTWYWNFCSGNINNDPDGTNIGNPGNLLNVPTYSTLVSDNGKCYSFISNQGTQSVIRYDHGSSFSNAPTNTVNLGSLGCLSDDVEGIQINKEGDVWIGFVCNYDQLVRLNFGTSLENIPTATVIGPVPELEMAHGFLLFEEGNEWTGLITCSIGNKLVRVHFGNSLLNTPAFENLGTVGSLNSPGQFTHVIDAGTNYIFMVNLGNSSVSRLDFGNSINNMPTGVNLGTVCGSLAMGITLLRDCGTIQGFITRYLSPGASGDLLWKISFPEGITGPIVTQSLGNTGALDRPCLFSELFRENDNLYVYVSNRDNGTRTLLTFTSCINATPSSSTSFNPPVFSYDTPGIYNIRLLVNEGLPNQVSVCKSIVVIDQPVIVSADFTIPDTVCKGTPVAISNLSTGGTSYYWNFCSGSILSDPLGVNIGNPGNQLDVPVYISLAKDAGICYSFITNRGTASVIRYNHGSSFSNNPVAWTDLGSFGMLNDSLLGLKICRDNGQWIGFVNNNNRIVRFDFGTSLANTPVAAVLGPYSILNTSHCLDIIQEGSTWVAYLTCSLGNKIVRLNFGNSLMNMPALTDLGAPGSLNSPGSFRLVKESGLWSGLVVNMGDNTVTRLTFGASLQNNPSGINLGTVCPSISPGGISLISDCDGTAGFQLNYSTTSADLIWRLSLPSGVAGPVSGASLGNIGNLSRPAHFSELFRDGDTLFLYVTNRQDYTLTRMRFLPCTNASAPSSTLFTPPPYSYNQPGTYNIQLIVNEGMPDQSSLCKKIVVTDQPITYDLDTTLCHGIPWHAGGAWQTQAGVYYDTIRVIAGCDSIIRTTLGYKPEIPVSLGNDTMLCEGFPLLLGTGVHASGYQWQDGSTDSVYSVFSAGLYWVIVTLDGCSAGDSILIGECASPLWFPNVFTPNGDGLNETFHPVGQGIVTFNVLIYDRWGRKVYESDAPEPGWDGSVNGKPCAEGVYVFIAEYTISDSSGEAFHAKGSVTILR